MNRIFDDRNIHEVFYSFFYPLCVILSTGVTKSIDIFPVEKEIGLHFFWKDLFDIVSRKYLAKGVRKHARITIPADASAVIVELPAGSVISRDENGNLTVNKDIIAYEKAN